MITLKQLLERVKDGKVDPLSKMGKSKLTGREISNYYKDNPDQKKAARDKDVKKGIELALDLGGAMDYARKELEKFKRGLSKHPAVKKALMHANESVSEENGAGDFGTDKLRKKYEKDTPKESVNETKRQEVDAMKKISKDMQSVLKAYQKVATMGDKTLKDTKYNAQYKKVLDARDTILTMIGTLNTQMLLTKEETNLWENLLQEEMITYRVKKMQKPEEDKFQRSAKMMGLKYSSNKGRDDTVIVVSGTKKKLRDFDSVVRGKSSYGDPSTIKHFDEGTMAIGMKSRDKKEVEKAKQHLSKLLKKDGNKKVGSKEGQDFDEKLDTYILSDDALADEFANPKNKNMKIIDLLNKHAKRLNVKFESVEAKGKDLSEFTLFEKAKIILSDNEMKEVQKVVSKAIGKKVDMRMGDSDFHTGAIDFGGVGKYDMFVGSKREDGKLPYKVTVEDPQDGDYIDGGEAKDYKSMLQLVTKLAKKHKKGLMKEDKDLSAFTLSENTIEKMRDIVSKKSAMKINGVMVDMFTASAVVQIYDKVNDGNKKKMEKMKPAQLANLAMKIMQKQSTNEGAENIVMTKGKMTRKVDAMTAKKMKRQGWKMQEAVSPAQQAAIAISKKEKGEKPKKENRSARRDAMRGMSTDKDFMKKDDDDIVATPDDRKAADKNPLIQLRRIADLPKGGDMEFKDGKKKKITQKDAMKALKGFGALRKNPDKLKFQTAVGKSHSDLKRILKLIR